MFTPKKKQPTESNKEIELKSKLNSFLDKPINCGDEDCLMNEPAEIVKRENKKIITSDGRQLLSEYTV